MGISSNVIYVEPNYACSRRNQYNSYNADGELEKVDGLQVFEMAPPLEDYCVAFQLAVEVPAPTQTSTVTTNNTVFVLTSTNGQKDGASLFMGTKPAGSSINFLTTAALETTLEDVIQESPTEMFGVNSIDITYNSWVSPQIVMKFTDIRGASMFTPEELAHPTINSTNNVAGSFFKCFFIQPCPRFCLLIKGFYGEAVAYETTYTNFSFKINSSTGNFEAEAKLLGYSWSLLNDVSFNAAAVAPFCEYDGEEYWKSQVEAGVFVTREGTPMPRLGEIVKAYKNLKEGLEGTSAQLYKFDNTATENEEITSKQQHYDTAISGMRDALQQFQTSCGEHSVPHFAIGGNLDNGIAICVGASTDSSKTVVGNFENAYKALQGVKIACESGNLSLFPTTFDLTKEANDSFSKYDNCATQYITKLDENGAFSFITEGEIFENITNSELKSFISTSLSSTWPSLDVGAELYFIIINTSKWLPQMVQEQQQNEELLAKNEDEMREKMKLKVAEAIGMAPTMHNFVKVMFAHMETLVHCMHTCVEDIPAERTIESANIENDPQALENVAKLANEEGIVAGRLQPFPTVKDKKVKDGTEIVEDAWLGDMSQSDELKEVELVEKLLLATDKMYTVQVGGNVIQNPDGTTHEIQCKVPTVPSDLFIEKPIWDLPKINSNCVGEIIGALGVRASYVLEAMYDCWENASIVGALDAVNFHDLNPKGISSTWISFLKSKDENEFWSTCENILFEASTPSEDIAYALPELPWQQKEKVALLDRHGLPNLPKIKDGEYAYPIENISFSLNGLGQTTTTNDFKTFATVYNLKKKIESKALFRIIPNISLLMGAKNLFDDEKVSSIKNVKNIKDNYEKMYKWLEKNLNQNTYGELYGEDNCFSSDFSHISFMRTFASTEDNAGKSINNFKPVTDKIDKKNLSYTFPLNQSDVDANYGTAFNTTGELSGFNMLEVKIYNGNSVDTLTRDEDHNLGVFLKNNENLSNWSVNQICGIDQVGATTKYTSIFTQEPYINARSNYEKATLFLIALSGNPYGLDIKECKDTFTKMANNGKEMFHFFPYLYILLAGSYVLWYRSKDKAKFYRYKKEDDTFYNTGVHHIFTETRPCNTSGNWAVKAGLEFLKDVRKELQCALGEEFVAWVNGTSSPLGFDRVSFKEIQDELDPMFPKGSDGESSAAPIAQLLNGKTKLNGSSLEQTLIKKGLGKIFKNYISIKSAKKGYQDFTFRMFLREDTPIARKLSKLFVQPALVVWFNEWIKLNGEEVKLRKLSYQKNIGKFAIKEYFKGFYDKYCKLLGIIQDEEVQQGSQSAEERQSAEDLEKHVKISLYLYLKTLNDKWLQGRLYLEEPYKHFGVDKFFKEHVHFINQHYMDCSDVYFDMDKLAETFENSLTRENYSFMSFMTDALAGARCALFPVQNFLNYFQDGSAKKMNNMFKPLSYNEAFQNSLAPDQIYPDFIVMYSSTPSKSNEDAFMLNADEPFLPYPIRSGNGQLQKRIPAFGVTYGKQYQSYFQTIDVSTEAPIPTEQSLTTQYNIAAMNYGKSGENGQMIQSIGQDLYTIYSTQSYSCTVQMMGNMWIQPLMYFVLTNVPTFRGSYQIMKVQHQITPGKMTTSFTGVRMSATNTPEVNNWAFGKNSAAIGEGMDTTENIEGRNASIDNDCAYKKFIPGAVENGSSGIGDLSRNGLIFILSIEGWSGSKGDADYGAACTVKKVGKNILYGPGLTTSVVDTVGHPVRVGDTFSGDEVWDDFIKVTNKSVSEIERYGASVEKYGQNGYDVLTYLQHWLPVGAEQTVKKSANAQDIASILTDQTTIIYPKRNWTWYQQAYAETKNDSGAQQIIDDLAAIARGETPDNPGWRYKCYAGTARPKAVDLVNNKLGTTSTSTTDSTQKTAEDDLKDLVESIKQTCIYSNSINISEIHAKYATYETEKFAVAEISTISTFDKPSKDNAILFDIALSAYQGYWTHLHWKVSDENSLKDFPISVLLWYKIDGKKPKSSSTVIVVYRDPNETSFKQTYSYEDVNSGLFNDFFYSSLSKNYLNGDSLTNSFFGQCSNYTKVKKGSDDAKKVAQMLINKRPEPCNVGNSEGGELSNSNVPITGGDWPSAVKDIYAWVAEVYKWQTTNLCGGKKCDGKFYEFENKKTTTLLPSEAQKAGVPIDCSGAAWQAVRSYYYRMKLTNASGFNEEVYKELNNQNAIGSDGFALGEYKGWSLLQKAGFEILPFNKDNIKPWDILAKQKKGNGYGHVAILGEQKDGVWTLYNATTHHKPGHKVVQQHKNSSSIFNIFGGTSKINKIIRLKKK